MRKIFCVVAIAAAFGSAGQSQAADMPARIEGGPPNPVYVPNYVWAGFYMGLFGGGRWATVKDNASIPTVSANGWTVGGVSGFNMQVGNIVYGAEADFGAGDTTGSNVAGGGVIARADIKALGNLRARVGLAMDRFLVFVAGGGSIAHMAIQNVAFPGAKTHWMGGWTVGGGVEYAALANWILRVEYLYGSYSAETFAFTAPVLRNISIDPLHTVRGAVLMKF